VIGRTFSHYRIVGQLGAGGMGVVYRAEDDRLGRAVALKVLPEEMSEDRQAVQRLHAEARAASALNHANICAIYDIGHEGGRPFIVMELLKGHNLRDRLAVGPLKIHELVDIGIQIADALDAAHHEGIIHRDIKPANIFLTERHQVKLLDFGVAKLSETHKSGGTTGTPELTAAGATVGTIAYMSPEQATGEVLDARTDLFSLGVVLYEAATGRPPFSGKTSAVILSAILNRTPIAPISLNPELPLHLQEVINNCLEKDRELRCQSAADLRAELKRLRRDIESGQSRSLQIGSSSATPRASSSSVRAASSSGIERTEKLVFTGPRDRRMMWTALISLAAAAAVAAGVYVLRPRSEAPVASAPSAPAALTEADVQKRIDQAAGEIAARLAEQAKQAEADRAAAAAPPLAPAPAPRRPAEPPPQSNARAETKRVEPVRAEAARADPQKPEPEKPEPARAATPVEPPEVLPPPPTVTQPPPRVEAPTPAANPAPAAPTPPPAVAAPTPPPVAASPAIEPRREPAAPVENDDTLIRQLIATYARAIESKDIALFRSVKPNLTREEQRRLEDGFRAVSKQSVNITIQSIERKDNNAVVALTRRDTIVAGGRQQQTESRQVLMLARTGGAWHVTAIR
jgi:serine/threonine protein kinase